MSGWDFFWAGFYATLGVGWALTVGLITALVIGIIVAAIDARLSR